MHPSKEQMKQLAKVTGIECPACDDSKKEDAGDDANDSDEDDGAQVEIKSMSIWSLFTE